MTHHVKQSSFAGVWQCYSYVRHTNTHTHTHTHTHTKAHKNQPPHPPSPSHSLAWLPAQLPPTSYHESDTLLSAEAPVKLCDPETFLCKEPIHPTNILQTFFVSYSLQGQICKVKLLEMLVAFPHFVPVSYLVLTSLVKTWHLFS